nr:hypothetical protein [Candidatus Sigynarchaeum springense]
MTFPADWTIGQNVVGNFRVQARWNTTTEAGFISTTFLVLGRMNIGLSSVVQYGSPLSQLGGRYQGQYGDNIEMNYDMTDANNGSAISNLAYTFTTNGTPDASNTTSLSTLAQPLPFATRAVNNYSVVVTFQRTYYHNYTATVNIEIDKCPTTVILQYIRRSGVSLYQNGSGIYFTNTSTFTVTYEYRNSRTDALITSLSNADVYEGTHHFTSSSSTGTFDVNVNPASLATGVVLNFQASANNTNYLTSQALFQLVVDNTTPMTNIIYTPACAPNFVTNSTAFTLSASDPTSRPSGVKNMYYRIGGSGGYTLYSGAFNLLGWSNGSILIEYYSIDNANNVQAPNSTTVKLDLNKPTSSINNPAEYAPNWVDENATFVITANDGGLGESGVASTYYRLNAGGWMPYAGPFTLGSQPNGTYTISYYSIDRVGNAETVKSATFRLDKNAPTSSLNDPTEYAPNWVDENATFVITAADAGTGETGIASTYYRLNAGGWTPYAGPFTLGSQPNGTYTISYYSIDRVGNAETAKSATFRLDKNAPVSSLNDPTEYAPNWVDENATFVITAVDAGAGETGVASTYYRLNAGGWTPYAGPFTLGSQPNGTYTISYYSIDRVGNAETVKSATFRLDKNGPISNLNDPTEYPSNWVDENATFIITSADAGTGETGIASTYYRLNAGGWTPYAGPFTLGSQPNGTYTISYYSVDRVGNAETVKSATFRLDKNAPTSSLNDPTEYAPNWVDENATFVITAVDAGTGETGIANTYYRLNAGDWSLYAGPFTLGSQPNGTYTISYYSIDRVGNAETVKSATFRLDKNAPVSSLNDPTEYAPNWVDENATFVITAADAGAGEAGVASTYYRLNAGGWMPYAGPFTLGSQPNGTYTISYYSIDRVGNAETVKSATFRLDKNAPVSSLNDPTEYAPNWVDENATFVITAADAGTGETGIASTYYRLNAGGWTPYAGPFTLGSQPNGTYTISYYSVDRVGNAETAKSATFRLDKIAPNTTISVLTHPPNFTNGTRIFTLDHSDFDSGWLRTEYRINSSGWIIGTSFTIPINGTYTIDYRSVDNVGNVEVYGTRVFRVDTIRPNSTISFVPHYGLDVINKTTQFSISSSDNDGGSGVSSRYYKIGSSSYVLYAAPFNLGTYANGTYTIQYYSVDNVGNTEAPKSIIIRLDIEGPVVTISNPKNQTYGTSTISITLVSTSPDFNKSWYSIWYTNNGTLVVSNRTWTTGLEETLEDGSFRIRAWGNDTYGNVKQSAIDVIFTVDTSIPIIVMLSPVNTTYTSQVLSVVIRNDSLCDYAAFRYNDGSGWIGNITLQYNGTHWVNDSETLADGHYQVQVFARYMSGMLFVGNEWFTIDTNAPVTTIDVDEEINILGMDYVNASSTISFSVLDISAVLETRFWFDSSPTKQLYSGPFSLGMYGLANGLHTIYYNSTDIVNHVEVTKSVTVYLDINPPTTLYDYVEAHVPDYVNETTIFTLVPSDGTGEAGIQRTYYRIGASVVWSVYSTPFNLMGESNGTILIEYFSIDRANNTENVKSFTVRLDKNAPVSSLNDPTEYAPNWVDENATFVITAADAGAGETGIASTYYRLNAGGWTPYAGPFTLGSQPNGTYTISYYSIDRVGNAEMVKSATFRLDKNAPTSSLNDPTEYAPNWVDENATFVITAADAGAGEAGVASTYYRLNAGGWTPYAGPFTLGSQPNGTYTISYYSIDRVGNNETVKSATFRLDKNAPTSSLNDPTEYAPNWVDENATFVITAVDAGAGEAGVASTYYRLNAGGWTPYAGPFTLGSQPNGTYTISYYSIDRVGNNETAKSATFRLDKNAPTSSLNDPTEYAPNWVDENATFVITAADAGAGETGVASTYYRLNAGGWTPYAGPFTLGSQPNGTYTISYYSIDRVGNNETVKSATFRLDKNAPTSSLNDPTEYAPNWVDENATFVITAADAGAGETGVSNTYYCINMGSWLTYLIPFTLGSLTNGTYTISYYSVDRVGNAETVKSATFRLDKNAPISFINNPIEYAPNWVDENATFIITCNDLGTLESGVASTYYRLNAGGWTPYAGPFMLGSQPNGTYTISYYSIDRVGNAETVKSATFRLDKNAPTSSLNDQTEYAPNWVDENATFVITAADAGAGEAGVANTYFRINSGTWTGYSGAFTLGSYTNGTYTISYYSIDRVGNAETVKSATFRLDKNAPVSSLNDPTEYAPNWVDENATFVITAADAGAGETGIASTYYRLNAGGWMPYAGPFTLGSQPNGTYTISYYSVDRVGNAETAKSATFRLDKIAPNTTISYTPYPPNFVNLTTIFSLSAADNAGGSGIGLGGIQYSFNGANWSVYLVPFTLLTTNGTVTIYYRSTDRVGNRESFGLLVVRLDTIAPNSTCTYTRHYNPNFVNLTTTFNLMSADNPGGSGTAYIEYRIGSDPWTQYVTPFTLAGKTNGTYIISHRAVDNVGNTEFTKTFTVRLDIEGPAMVIASPENQTYGTTQVIVILSTTAPDYNASWYTITNMSSGLDVLVNKTWTGPIIETLSNDSFRIRAWGNDTYGNIKQAADVYFTIDISAPQITLIKPVNQYYATTTILVQLQNDTFVDTAWFRIYNGVAWSGNSSLVYNGTYWVNSSLILSNGSYIIDVFAKRLSSKEAKVSRQFRIDTISPNTTISVLTFAPNFTNGTRTFTLTGTDNPGGSGILRTEYRIDAGGWTIGTMFTIPTNGTHTVYYRSIDNMNNLEAYGTMTYRVDTIAPNTTITVTTYGTNFVNGTRTFILGGSDNAGGSGVQYRQYRIDGGLWMIGNSFTIAANGTHVVDYRSVDNVNNVEPFGTRIFRVDSIAPNTTISVLTYAPNFTNGTRVFTLGGSDNAGGSGVQYRQYRIDGGLWMIGNSFTIAANGTHVVDYRSVDNVNNVEPFGTRIFRVDTIAPTTSVSFVPSSGIFFVNASTTFTLAGLDNSGGSGIAYRQYNINGTWQLYTGAFTLSGLSDGLIRIRFRSVDNVNNVETAKYIDVYLGSADPITTTISYTSAGGFVRNDTLFTLLPTVLASAYQNITGVFYSINGSVWTMYTAPFNLTGFTSGSWNISFYAQDNCSNVEAVRSEIVVLDADAPHIIGGISIPALVFKVGDVVIIRITCDSAGYYATISFPGPLLAPSGIRASQTVPMTSLGNGTYEYSWNTAGLIAGTYTIIIDVTDQAGNSIRVEQAVVLERKGPGIWDLIILIIAFLAGVAIIIGVVRAIRKKAVKVKASKEAPGTKGKGKVAPVYDLASTLASKETPSPETKTVARVQPEEKAKTEAKEKLEVKAKPDAGIARKPEAKTAPKAELDFLPIKEAKPASKAGLDFAPIPEAKPAPKEGLDFTPIPEARPEAKRTVAETKKKEAKSSQEKAAVKSAKVSDTKVAHVDEKLDIKIVEARLSELFAKHNYFIPSKTDVYNEMKELGFSMLQIELAFDNLRRAESIVYNAGVPRGWQFKKQETKK